MGEEVSKTCDERSIARSWGDWDASYQAEWFKILSGMIWHAKGMKVECPPCNNYSQHLQMNVVVLWLAFILERVTRYKMATNIQFERGVKTRE
jgi:hypothetical protein